MKNSNIRSVVLALLSVFALNAAAQQKMLTVEDAVLRQRTTLAPERLSQLNWIPGSNLFAYVARSGSRECIVQCDAVTLKKDTVLCIDDFREVARSANPDMGKPGKFPVFTWIDRNAFRFYYECAYYTYDLASKRIRPMIRLPKKAEDMDYEPKGNRVAYTIGNNLFVSDGATVTRPAQSGNDTGIYEEDRITTDGRYGIVNGKSVHRNEFGITKGTFWSPKGTRVAYYKMYEDRVTDYPVLDLESMPARPENVKYPMAGSASHHVKVFIQDMEKKRQVEVQTGLPEDQYLTNVCWSPSEDYLYIAVVNRAQNEMKLNMYDGMTGVFIKTLFSETHGKYVEPMQGLIFVKNKPSLFLWFSERDGYNHLYLYDSKGRMQKQVTKGKFDVKEVLGFDKKGAVAYYIAASEDGLDRYCCSVNLSTGKTFMINKVPGVHSAIVNDEGTFILDSYSNLTTPRRTSLMDNAGGEKALLLNAANPIWDYKTCGSRIFSIPSHDGTVNLNCRMFFPPGFDSSKLYPVLVYVYGGPHAQMITNSWLGNADMWLYYMAQQGFVVFTLDNRGSDNRGLDFENIVHRRLGVIERDDQLAGVEYLKKQKYVDQKRLGVFGWSFGGFMSISMMSRSDHFKAGVAGGPVIDWGMYEIMYTERYMDTPQENPEGYRDANLLNHTKGLKGKLLVIHGTADDVVVWQHSLKYIRQCVDDGVQLDYFVYPAHKHNVNGKDRVHLMTKIAGYFMQNL